MYQRLADVLVVSHLVLFEQSPLLFNKDNGLFCSQKRDPLHNQLAFIQNLSGLSEAILDVIDLHPSLIADAVIDDIDSGDQGFDGNKCVAGDGPSALIHVPDPLVHSIYVDEQFAEILSVGRLTITPEVDPSVLVDHLLLFCYFS